MSDVPSSAMPMLLLSNVDATMSARSAKQGLDAILTFSKH